MGRCLTLYLSNGKKNQVIRGTHILDIGDAVTYSRDAVRRIQAIDTQINAVPTTVIQIRQVRACAVSRRAAHRRVCPGC